MQPAPQALKHSAIAPHMLLRCEGEWDIPCKEMHRDSVKLLVSLGKPVTYQ